MKTEQKIKPRKVLEQIEPYQPGKPIWEVQKELGIDRVVKLASNENPLGPSLKVIEAVSNSLKGINRYPDANSVKLKEALALHLKVKKQQIILTNGADELITLISETFLEEGNEVIVPSPSFSEYNFGAHLMGAKVVPVPLGNNFYYDINSIISAVTENTKIIYICSPNNPTGTYMTKGQLQQLLDSLPERVLVVFDGAYSHYAEADDYTNGVEFVALGYPILTLQTFSEIYALAGIRAGYGVASEEIIQSIVKVKEPFNVNMLAQAGAVAALADDEHVKKSQEVNKHGRELLYRGLSNLGLTYVESMSNFVLVKIGKNAEDIYKSLMKKGVIVRYGDTWNLPEYVRISVGTHEENAFLIGVLSSILQNKY